MAILFFSDTDAYKKSQISLPEDAERMLKETLETEYEFYDFVKRKLNQGS